MEACASLWMVCPAGACKPGVTGFFGAATTLLRLLAEHPIFEKSRRLVEFLECVTRSKCSASEYCSRLSQSDAPGRERAPQRTSNMPRNGEKAIERNHSCPYNTRIGSVEHWCASNVRLVLIDACLRRSKHFPLLPSQQLSCTLTIDEAVSPEFTRG